MFGSRLGSKGALYGSRIGSNVDDESGVANPMSSVTRDGSSAIYCPNTLAEWTTTMSAAGLATGNPSLLWRCQEASGNLADSIGSFTATVSGSVAYQQVVPGWSRLAFTGTNGGTGSAGSSAGGLPDISTTSILLLTYASIGSLTNNRTLTSVGAATHDDIGIPISGKMTAVSGANTATSVAAVNTGAVFPFVLKRNVTGSVTTGYNLTEKLTPTFSASSTGVGVFLGRTNAQNTNYLYHAAFFGTAAELSDAQVKTLLQTLGWAPTWT